MDNVQLFVIRVWQHLRQFRASVRALDDDAPRLFLAPEELSEFLRRAAEAPAEADDPARNDSSGR
jgi:hypothetical protein